MAKIANDKYYTPIELAKYCVDKTLEVIGKDNITEFIEPSAGSGVFLDCLDELDIPYLAYDIEPEDEKGRVVKQDYLSVELEYKKGRCVIGNPPFGSRNTLSVRFFKKSILFSDYISFILPISQLKNNQQMYEFDLIHSEDLGKREYSDRVVHCCLNIYKRNANGELNKKQTYKLKDVEIIEFRSKDASLVSQDEYDLLFCFWGAIGKICNKGDYSHIMGIKIHNNKHKEHIIEILLNVNWFEKYQFVASPALYQWQVYKYLKEQIPELK